MELYEANKYSMQNSITEVGPYLYPLGFPILITPIYAVWGLDFILLKVICCLFFLGSLPLIFRFMKPRLDNYYYALVLTALLAFNGYFTNFGNNILSDFPFFYFLFLSFYLFDKKESFWKQLLLGACIFYTYLIRDVGLFLIPTYLAFQFSQRKTSNTKWSVKLLPVALFLVLFSISKALIPPGGENHVHMILSEFSWALLIDNIHYYLLLFSKFFFFGQEYLSIGILVSVLVLMGVLSSFSKTWPFALFLTTNLFMLIIWPSQQGMRFIFPILPFLTLYLIKSFKIIADQVLLSAKNRYRILMAFCLLFVFKTVLDTFKYPTAPNQVYTDEMQEIYNYVVNNIPETETIGATKPRVLALFSNAKSVVMDLEHFNNAPIKYLLVTKVDAANYHWQQFGVKKEFANFLILEK